MTFEELCLHIKTLPYQEARSDETDYLERVFTMGQLTEVAKGLEIFFGPALKPTGQNPSGDVKKITKEFGGIRSQQTLYFCQKDNHSFVAMFWPWSNGQLVTLKLYQLD